MMAPCFGHRRLIAASTDTRAKCQCHMDGCCPKHDPLGYTGDAARHSSALLPGFGI